MFGLCWADLAFMCRATWVRDKSTWAAGQHGGTAGVSVSGSRQPSTDHTRTLYNESDDTFWSPANIPDLYTTHGLVLTSIEAASLCSGLFVWEDQTKSENNNLPLSNQFKNVNLQKNFWKHVKTTMVVNVARTKYSRNFFISNSSSSSGHTQPPISPLSTSMFSFLASFWNFSLSFKLVYPLLGSSIKKYSRVVQRFALRVLEVDVMIFYTFHKCLLRDPILHTY